jgi:hypothetical protein
MIMLLVACGLVVGAATASASRVFIAPSGAVTERSIERIRFISSEGTVECVVSLRGTLVELATGTLTRTPEPAVNPRIGTFREGTVSECRNGEIRVLNPGQKYVYAHNVEHPERWLMFILDFEELFSTGLLTRCLYRLQINYLYESRTGQLIVQGTQVLERRALTLGVCPMEIAIEGTSQVEVGGRTPQLELV